MGYSRPVEFHGPGPASGRSTSGQLDRFGAIDPTDRGETHRYSLLRRVEAQHQRWASRR